MAGKYGVKETQELLYVVKVAALAVIVEAKKGGFQITDLGAFLKSSEFEAAILPALTGVEAVPSELAELDLLDDLALGRFAYGVVMDIVDELKKVPALAK